MTANVRDNESANACRIALIVIPESAAFSMAPSLRSLCPCENSFPAAFFSAELPNLNSTEAFDHYSVYCAQTRYRSHAGHQRSSYR